MYPNKNAMGPVAYKGNQWVGYDDVDIVKKKAEYVAENGLGGLLTALKFESKIYLSMNAHIIKDTIILLMYSLL